ncbi:MAG: hypothetical protein RLY23_1849 [Actinomycetota bacterium]
MPNPRRDVILNNRDIAVDNFDYWGMGIST